MADLTIIMPTWNKADTIAEALDSVFRQKTSRTFRVVVADDHSTDGSLDVVARFDGDAGFPVAATTILERFFRNLAELKDAAMRGRADDVASELFGSPWAAKKNIALLSKWSLQELRIASARFLQLRERAVSGASDAGELVVVEIARALRRR